jgi:hypothetical protein
VDYQSKPIIIEGANHSGTRVLVEMLSILGSDGGDYSNPWKENKFFLDIHTTLVEKISSQDWGGTIFNLSFIREYQDDLSHKGYIENLLNNDLAKHYPAFRVSPWHWKCPSSALFEKTWVHLFPEAYYLHIVRDPLQCAMSLYRRGEVKSIKEGINFCNTMNGRIRAIPKKNYLRVRYENLNKEIEAIASFLPFDIDRARIDSAKSVITRENLYWRKTKLLLSVARAYLKNVKGLSALDS